jgi:uncharacterized protein YwqG
MDPGLRSGLIFFFTLCSVMSAVAFIQERLRQQRRPPLDHGATYRMREKMRRMSRPTLLLVPARAPGFSKLGGLPEMPSGVSWPAADETPAFVAQIDIAAFRSHGEFDWLPEAGRLYLFFDDSLNGAAECGKVIYSVDPPGPEIGAPPQLPMNRRFAERRVAFMSFKSLPSQDWLEEDWSNSRIDWKSFAGLGDDFGDEIEHRIGGYPSEIQGGQMAVECEYLHRGLTRDYREPVPDDIRRASWQWRLLLQIDSDPALNMNWWDGGRLYVFVRARDAKRGEFSKTVTITQTH